MTEQTKGPEQMKAELVEFDNTPHEELEAMAMNLMTPEEQRAVIPGEIALILRIARKKDRVAG